jgi:sterol desaturase/sphingolipid hydroxylase (fatty acid hydroxylase superfamily)
MITGARHHWLASPITAFFPLFPILFQTPPEIIAVGNLIYFLPEGCAHLNFRFSLGPFMMWLNSPQYHRIHHSTLPEHMNKNFAGMLPLWDIIFGTAYKPDKDEFTLVTGLPEGDKPKNIWESIIWPLRNVTIFKRAQ